MSDEKSSSLSAAGQRTLAAIVFTDTVDFSARMGRDEDRTLEAVRGDLAWMKELCIEQGGQVLKNTGDGLLMYFTSAVQAVSCAQQIQVGFFERVQGDPGALMHRIGIHLGDVFVSDSDVMGDGVNIAARLQAEATPGGICLSQTVYDVVKNRLELKATYLGPRDLKNIREAVPVYQILLAAQNLTEKKSQPRRRTMVMAGAIAAVVLVALGGSFLMWHSHSGSAPAADVAAARPGSAPAMTASRPGPRPMLHGEGPRNPGERRARLAQLIEQVRQIPAASWPAEKKQMLDHMAHTIETQNPAMAPMIPKVIATADEIMEESRRMTDAEFTAQEPQLITKMLQNSPQAAR